MLKSDSIAALAAALSIAQGMVEGAKKESNNPHLRSKYADLSSVWDACRAALSSNGLSVVQMPCDAGEGRVGLTTLLAHSSGEYLSETVSVALSKADAQSLGSALTYLKRYSLTSFVGIAPEDDDGHAATAAQAGQPSSVKRPAQPSRIPTITGEQAARLATTLADLGVSGSLQLGHASRVLERPIQDLTELTAPESKRVFEAARAN